MTLLLALSFAACGKTEGSTSEPQADSTAVQGFTKPEGYTSILLVTINPQFRLYLDADGNVLAVEAVNKDAEDIQKNITFENESYEKVIENIITTANENGFIKEDATVKLEIVEDRTGETVTATVESTASGTESTSAANTESISSADAKALKAKHTAEILSKAQAAANNAAQSLNVKIEVTVAGDNAVTESSASANSSATSSATSSAKKNTSSAVKSTTPESSASTASVHTHNFAAATCTQPKKCACGSTEGSPLGHSYKDGACVRCKAKDSDHITPIAKKAGTWTFSKTSGNELSRIHIDAYKTNGISFDKASAWETLSEEVKNNAEQAKIINFNGVKYLLMLADGFELEITESGKTVTVTDDTLKLVLTRTDEDTLTVTEADMPSYFPTVSVGDVFKFN